MNSFKTRMSGNGKPRSQQLYADDFQRSFFPLLGLYSNFESGKHHKPLNVRKITHPCKTLDERGEVVAETSFLPVMFFEHGLRRECFVRNVHMRCELVHTAQRKPRGPAQLGNIVSRVGKHRKMFPEQKSRPGIQKCL